MILLTIDAYSYSRLGYHISSASLEQVVVLLTNTWNDHPVRSFMWVFGISSAILALELILANFTWKRIESLEQRNWGMGIAAVLLTCFVTSHCIHVYADVKLNFDVTQQNNMFPFSYPATAKTLLAKNGLLDKQLHQQAQANQLALKKNLDYFERQQLAQCQPQVESQPQSLTLYLTAQSISAQTKAAFATQQLTEFSKHYVPSDKEDALFNLLFGLPALYKNSVIANQLPPQWLKLANLHDINVSIDDQHNLLVGFNFIADNLRTGGSKGQINIKTIDAQQLAALGQKPQQGNVIIIGGLAQSHSTEALVKSDMLVKWHNTSGTMLAYKGQVSQHLDINTTIINSFLRCQDENTKPIDSFGKDFTIKQPKVLAANYSAGTIVSIHKDKITMLDDLGNALQISATNGYKLNQALDIPSLNDTINLLTRYSVRAKN